MRKSKSGEVIVSMHQGGPESEAAAVNGGQRTAKKPYEAPAIEESAPFETLALSCAKQEEVAGCAGGPFFNS